MKNYEIEVNNEIYRVSVKELSDDADMSNEQAVSTPNKESKAKKTPESAARSSASSEGSEVKAPMAGTILNINVSTGQNVSQGDILMVLEAMKMENEIVAPADGVVSEIFVHPNDRVESDQVLLKI